MPKQAATIRTATASDPIAATKKAILANPVALDTAGLFGDDAVGPFHHADKDRWIPELETPLGDVGFGDPASAAARAAGEHRNLGRDQLLERFFQRRPTDRNDRVHHSLAHQDGRVTK